MDAEAFDELIASLVRDDEARLSPGNFSQAASLAISRYSKDRPNKITEDCEVLEDLLITTPESWVNHISSIVSIEAPIGRNPPSYVVEDYYYVYDLPDGDVELRLLTAVVGAGGSCRVRYTAPHAAADTIPAEDVETVAALAASILCEQLATLYGHDSIPTVQADAVQHNEKARLFAARSRDYRNRYNDAFGKSSHSGGAGAIGTCTPARPGRMFHK